MAAWILGTAIVGTATWVGAWMPTGNSPFTLPPATASQPPVWMPTKGAKRVGVRVATASGKTHVRAGPTQPGSAVVGTVPAGTSALFEGVYGYLNVEADASGTAAGNWDARELGLPSDAMQAIGSGTVTLPVPGGPSSFHFYGNDAPVTRIALVTAGLQPVTVIDGLGNQLVNLEPGDWTLCVRSVRKYGLATTSGTAAAHAWEIADVPTGAGAFAWNYAGVANCQPNDTGDQLSLDGTANVHVKITNTSASGTITVLSSGGSSPNPAVIGPGAYTECAGALTVFSWTYSGPGMSAGIVVSKN
jgi:hypothetical protein